MQSKKIVTYFLMVSKTFPATHPRRGDLTHFREQILRNCIGEKHISGSCDPFIIVDGLKFSTPKIHTIRENYDLWARRAEKINAGQAVLSLRQWTGKPYRSKQKEFLRLSKIYVQEFKIITGSVAPGIPPSRAVFIDRRIKNIHEVSQNDGLSVDDFCKWFKKDMEGVVIHFSDKIY